MLRSRTAHLLLAAALGPLVACSPPGADHPGGTERSTTGWGDSAVLTEVLRTGALDGPLALGRLTDLALHPDGGVVVYDELANQLRRFSLDGRELGPIGGGGQGPGEYAGVNGLAVLPDGRVVARSMDARMVVFDPDGRPLEAWSFDGDPMMALMHDRKLSAGRDGSVAMQVALTPEAPFRPGPRGFVRYSASGEVIDTLSGFDTRWDDEAVTSLPTHPTKHLEWSPAGYAVSGVSSRASVTLFRPGDPVVVDFAAEPVSYPAEQLAQWVAHADWLRDRLESFGAPDLIPELSPSMPVFQRILPSRTGEIWVQLSTPSTRPAPYWSPERMGAPTVPEWESPLRFVVIDSAGVVLADLSGPTGIEPKAVSGDTLWGYARGDFGEQYITTLVVAPGPGG